MKSAEMGMNQYTTYFRELDSRIMRWTCPDPVNNYWQSPYVVMDGNPVALVDPIGAQSDGGSSGSTTFSPDGTWDDPGDADFDYDVDADLASGGGGYSISDVISDGISIGIGLANVTTSILDAMPNQVPLVDS